MSTEIVVYESQELINNFQHKVIPVDFNIIELPLFSKNKTAKINEGAKYIISLKKNIQVEIIPVVGMSIPVDFDKRVYFALVQLAQEFSSKFKKDNVQDTLYTTFYEVYNKLGIQWKGGKIADNHMFPVGSTKERIYQSLSKLAGTKYKLYNCFYDAEIAKKDENLYESTFIHSIKIIKLSQAIDDNHKALEYIKSNSNEIIELKLNSFFLTNILNKKGHLKHSIADYNKINDPVARDIYFWCDKNRKWLGTQVYGNDKQIQVKVKKLAACLPLAFSGSNVPKTVYRVREAFDNLLDLNLISSFCEHRSENGIPLSETWYEVAFNWSRDDKEYVVTGREGFELEEIKSLPIQNLKEVKIEDIDENLLTLINPVIKKITPKTLQMLVYKYTEKKDIGVANEFISATLKYVGTKAKKNYDKYLHDALEFEWAHVYVVDLLEENERVESQKLVNQKAAESKRREIDDKVKRRNEIIKTFELISVDERVGLLSEFIEKITKKNKNKLPEILKEQEDYLISYWALKNNLIYDGFKQMQLTTWKI